VGNERACDQCGKIFESKYFPYKSINLCLWCYEKKHNIILHTLRKKIRFGEIRINRCPSCQCESIVFDKNGNTVCKNCNELIKKADKNFLVKGNKIITKPKLRPQECPKCKSKRIRKASLSYNKHNKYYCKNCNNIWDFDIEEENFDHENKCPACGSENYEKKGFRNEKQRYICKDCGRNWTFNGIVKNLVVRKPKTKDVFQRENTLEEIIAYLKNQETSNMPLKFWYRDDTKPREAYDYFIDEKYVQVRADRGYYIKFLIDRIRKI